MKYFFKKLFCSHNYILVNQFEIESEFDIINRNGFVPKTWHNAKRLVVTDYSCTKCSKLKRLKAKTP